MTPEEMYQEILDRLDTEARIMGTKILPLGILKKIAKEVIYGSEGAVDFGTTREG